jgi:hypothetical protein
VTPIVRVPAAGSGRVSVAGLLATRPDRPTRLIYRMRIHRGRKREPKALTEDDYIGLLDAAHQQLGGPIVVWDKCAVRRFVASPTQSGGIWRNIPGSPDSPGGES